MELSKDNEDDGTNRLFQKLELIEKIYSEIGELNKHKKPEASSEIVDSGYKTTFTKRIGYADVYLFSLVSGDWNPVHHDPEFAEKTRFGKRIAHGMLTSSLVSTTLNLIPGTTILLKSSQEYL
jgi:3-hydroxybutyryl-CoA dehydratase